MDLEKLKNLNVLLVDDSDLNLALMGLVFKKWNVKFLTARNGADALDLFKATEFDIVITDIEMPIMRGTELLRSIRALDDPKKANVPVIALTAHDVEEKQKKYLDMGMNEVMVKPCTQDSLYRAIEKFA